MERCGKRAELLALFDQELAATEGDEAFYRRSKTRMRRFSYVCKGVAAVAFLAGSLAPFAVQLFPLEEVNVLGWGYACLVLAGLLLGIDQIFIASRNWSRFAKAELDIRLVRQLLELQRGRFAMTTPDDAIAAEKIESVNAIVFQARKEVAAIMKQETESWSTELDQASSRFEQMIKGAIDQARKDYDIRQVEANTTTAAQRTGAIRVQLKNPERIPGKMIVTVGEVVRELQLPPASLLFDAQPPGLRKVRLSWPDGTRGMRELDDATMVKPGEIASLTFEISASSQPSSAHRSSGP